ncbi:MAG: hypothetical protein ACKV1O_29910 [Saprospiraceae bacterium]
MENPSNKKQSIDVKQWWKARKHEWNEFWKNASLLGKIVILIGIVFVPSAPWIFTMEWGWGRFDSTTGAIGDTIGGITAPIVNLVSAILVYLAFKAQIKANEIISTQVIEAKNDQKIYYNRDYIFRLHELLKSELILLDSNNTKKEPGEIQKIIDYLYNPNHSTVPQKTVLKFNSAMDLLSKFLTDLEDINIPVSDKELLFIYIQQQYNVLLRESLSKVESQYSKEQINSLHIHHLIELKRLIEFKLLSIQSNITESKRGLTPLA